MYSHCNFCSLFDLESTIHFSGNKILLKGFSTRNIQLQELECWLRVKLWKVLLQAPDVALVSTWLIVQFIVFYQQLVVLPLLVGFLLSIPQSLLGHHLSYSTSNACKDKGIIPSSSLTFSSSFLWSILYCKVKKCEGLISANLRQIPWTQNPHTIIYLLHTSQIQLMHAKFDVSLTLCIKFAYPCLIDHFVTGKSPEASIILQKFPPKFM